MLPLSGSSVNQYSAGVHQRTVELEVNMGQGNILTQNDLPPIVDGGVNFANSGIRRRANVVFETQDPPPALIRALDSDNAMWKIRLDGQPQGEFFLRDFSVDDPGQNQNFRVYLQDESALIAERKTNSIEMLSGDVISVCEQILEGSGRGLFFTGTRTLGIHVEVMIDVDRDRWAFASELLAGYGMELLMAYDGSVLIRPFPVQLHVFAVDLSPLVLSVQSTFARRATNHLILLSKIDNRNVRFDLRDTDPSSSTWIWGPYGDVPKRFSFQGVPEAGLPAIADRLAQDHFGRRVSRTHSMIQIPRLDLGDSYKVGDIIYKVDQVSYSLHPTRPMYLTGRGDDFAIES